MSTVSPALDFFFDRKQWAVVDLPKNEVSRRRNRDAEKTPYTEGSLFLKQDAAIFFLNERSTFNFYLPTFAA
jgi:hypothetical protein